MLDGEELREWRRWAGWGGLFVTKSSQFEGLRVGRICGITIIVKHIIINKKNNMKKNYSIQEDEVITSIPDMLDAFEGSLTA